MMDTVPATAIPNMARTDCSAFHLQNIFQNNQFLTFFCTSHIRFFFHFDAFDSRIPNVTSSTHPILISKLTRKIAIPIPCRSVWIALVASCNRVYGDCHIVKVCSLSLYLSLILLSQSLRGTREGYEGHSRGLIELLCKSEIPKPEDIQQREMVGPLHSHYMQIRTIIFSFFSCFVFLLFCFFYIIFFFSFFSFLFLVDIPPMGIRCRRLQSRSNH